jgi:cytochrome c556
MNIMRGKLIVLLAGSLALGSASAGMAQEKATGIVAVRQLTMKANGDHMGAIKAILTEQPQLVKRVVWHAEAITEAAEYTPELFPAGSDQPPTAALPAIWNDQKGFQAAAGKAENLARQLAKTAQTGDVQATLAAFAALGKEGCGGCHQTYRKPQS